MTEDEQLEEFLSLGFYLIPCYSVNPDGSCTCGPPHTHLEEPEQRQHCNSTSSKLRKWAHYGDGNYTTPRDAIDWSDATGWRVTKL